MKPVALRATVLEEAERVIKEALAALPAAPILRPLRQSEHECEDAETGAPDGSVRVGRGYWLDGVDGNLVSSCVDAIFRYWTAVGFRIISDARPTVMFVAAVDPATLFGMSLAVGDDGTLSLVAFSPCTELGEE